MVGKCGVDGIEDTTCRVVGVIVGGTALGGDEQARATLEPWFGRVYDGNCDGGNGEELLLTVMIGRLVQRLSCSLSA